MTSRDIKIEGDYIKPSTVKDNRYQHRLQTIMICRETRIDFERNKVRINPV